MIEDFDKNEDFGVTQTLSDQVLVVQVVKELLY